MATYAEMIEKYRTFSPLENRDKPMIKELEAKFTIANKKNVQELAQQLNTIHEQHRIYIDKTIQLKKEYATSRETKDEIKLAEHSALARNKSYNDTLATTKRLSYWTISLQITCVVLTLILLYVVFVLC
jgi:chromosome segregation ATPase